MKASVIGCGRVGSAVAFSLIARGDLSELVMVGQPAEQAHGDAYDLLHASAFVRPTNIIAGEIAASVGSDVVVVTASAPNPSYTDRAADLARNVQLYRSLIPQLAALSPGAVFVIVTNPVDAMTWTAIESAALDWRRALGTGTLVDTARFRALLGEAWHIHANDIRAYILGEHGATQFPWLSAASAGGVRFREDDPVVRTAAAEAQIAGHRIAREKGFTNYAIAMATAMIVEAIANDSNAVLPVSVKIDGIAGVSGVCLSVPAVIGRGGIKQVLPIELTPAEQDKFRASASAVRAIIDSVQNIRN